MHAFVHLYDAFKVLFVSRVGTTLAQIRSYATTGPSLWNALPSSLPSLHLTLLSGSLSASISLLKTYFCSRGLRTGSDAEWSLLPAALYKFRNTIKIQTFSTSASSCVLQHGCGRWDMFRLSARTGSSLLCKVRLRWRGSGRPGLCRRRHHPPRGKGWKRVDEGRTERKSWHVSGRFCRGHRGHSSGAGVHECRTGCLRYFASTLV